MTLPIPKQRRKTHCIRDWGSRFFVRQSNAAPRSYKKVIMVFFVEIDSDCHVLSILLIGVPVATTAPLEFERLSILTRVARIFFLF